MRPVRFVRFVCVSPGAEHQALCVGTVGSRVVGGGNGVSKQPHPRPDVDIHLACTKEGLACRHTDKHTGVSGVRLGRMSERGSDYNL